MRPWEGLLMVMKTSLHKDALPKDTATCLRLLSIITNREIAPFLHALKNYVVSGLTEAEAEEANKAFSDAEEMLQYKEGDADKKLGDECIGSWRDEEEAHTPKRGEILFTLPAEVKEETVEEVKEETVAELTLPA